MGLFDWECSRRGVPNPEDDLIISGLHCALYSLLLTVQSSHGAVDVILVRFRCFCVEAGNTSPSIHYDGTLVHMGSSLN